LSISNVPTKGIVDLIAEREKGSLYMNIF